MFLIDIAESSPNPTHAIQISPLQAYFCVLHGRPYLSRKRGVSEGNNEPCYTRFALSDLVVSGALPPEGNSALHRFPQAPTA